jgi:hypothetical protein
MLLYISLPFSQASDEPQHCGVESIWEAVRLKVSYQHVAVTMTTQPNRRHCIRPNRNWQIALSRKEAVLLRVQWPTLNKKTRHLRLRNETGIQHHRARVLVINTRRLSARYMVAYCPAYESYNCDEHRHDVYEIHILEYAKY